MFDDHQKNEDEEVNEEPVHDPNIHELEAGGLRQFGGDGAVEGVHDQHGGDGNGDAGLEMLCLEVQSTLEQNRTFIS